MPGFTDKTWKGSRNCLLNSSLSSFSSGRSNSINYSYSDAIRYRSHPNICEIANLSRRASDSNGVLKMDELLSNNLVLDEDQTYKAYVSHVVENEPYTFYLQLGNSQEILIPSIKRSLEDSPRKPVSGMVFPGMCLMGSLTINSELRRCIITEVYNYGCKVFFCDYGSTGEIPFTHLYHVSHEATQIKPQALKFTLANTASLPDDPKTFDYLKNVLLGAQVQITIVGPTSHPILFCDMEFKGCDVKELILSYLAPLYYLPQILPSSDDTKVFVTHVESASKFFVQYASKLKLIESIQHSLNEIYSNSVDEGGPSSITIGSPVAVFDDEENCWARGLISEMMSNFFHVLKVDFGNTIKVERHYIRDIRKRSLVENFRCQTIECGLYDFEEDNCDLIWNNVISKLVPKNFYKMIVLAAKPHHLSVDLLDEKGESITKKIKVAHKQAINGHGVASSDVQAKEVKLSVQEAVHQPMVPNVLTYKLLDLKKGDNMVCYFVTLISPKEIYVQPSDSETEINNIGKILSSVSLSKLPSDQVSLYKPVVSLFPDDGNFYRGIITNIDDNQVIVTFVDYGNANSVDKSELYVLPDELKQISPQAVNVRFQNLPEVGDSEDLMKYQAIYEALDVINLQIKSVEVSQGGLVVYTDAPKEILLNFQTSDIKVPTVPAPYLVKEDPFALSHDDLGAEKFDDIESFSEEDEIDNVTVKELGSNASTTGIYLDSSNLEFSTFTENLELLKGQTFLVTRLSSIGDVSFIVKIHAIDLIMLVDPVSYHPVSVQFIIHVLDVKESRLVVDVYDVVGKHLGKGASISPIIPRPIVKREDIVFVSHYEGETIYITRVEDREKLDFLLNETYQYYDNTLEVDIDWKIGAICCAKSSDDNWYRAKILESYGSEFKVKFIDYGNSELVPKTNLRELSHRFFCEPELCVEIKLPIVLNENAEYDSSITNGTFKTLFYKKEGATWICDLTQDDEKLSSKLGTNMKCFRPEYLPERMPVGWNFQVSDSHKAYVTTVHSIDSFYVQLEADIPRLHMFQRVVNNFNDAGPIEKVFAALYSGDGSWYRAVDVPNGIRFIDYGNVETTNQKKSIPYECTFPAEGLALLVNLCVKPINQIWSSEAIKIFNQFIENRVEIKILSLLGRVVVDVISVSDSNSLSGILINSGYAKFTDYMPETISDLIQRRSEIINNSLTLINRSLPENELIGTKNPAFISFMLNVNDFYIQYIKQLEILERLKKMLIHAQHFDSVKNFNVGDILCVQHVDLGHEGKVWYRGKIISKDPLQALLLDYGLTVNVSDVRLLPLEIHNVPQLAVHCSLNLKIHPANDPLILQNHEIMLKLCQENLIVDFLTDGKPHIVSLKDSDDIEVFFNV